MYPFPVSLLLRISYYTRLDLLVAGGCGLELSCSSDKKLSWMWVVISSRRVCASGVKQLFLSVIVVRLS